jgi:hypothetical protein
MFKKIGLSVALMAGLFVFAPRPAKAEVHFGVYVGAPAYTYPAYPAYGYDAYPYPAPVYPAPTYVAPYSYGYGSRYYRDRDHDRHERREHQEHERHERNEHRFRR